MKIKFFTFKADDCWILPALIFHHSKLPFDSMMGDKYNHAISISFIWIKLEIEMVIWFDKNIRHND